MRHAGDADEDLEVARDELGPVVGDDARTRLRKPLSGSLKNNFDVSFLHGLADLPVDDEPL